MPLLSSKSIRSLLWVIVELVEQVRVKVLLTAAWKIYGCPHRVIGAAEDNANRIELHYKENGKEWPW